MRHLYAVLITIVLGLFPQGGPTPPSAPVLLDRVARGELSWQLSEPDEIRALFGAPRADGSRRDGDMELRLWTYTDTFVVFFGREFGTTGPFVLLGAMDGDKRVGPGPGAPAVLRTTADLAKLRPFIGLQNVDASRLDLRSEEARLRLLPFNTRTKWPNADRLPAGFDPAARLREGMNPGLGVRALQASGVDGRGVTIGIIDQPLVRDHVETVGRLDVVAEIDVAGVPPQMHGPAVSSLAAGRHCGVAPGARVSYVSMAMWKAQNDNTAYIEALTHLLDLPAAGGRPRVVSISNGAFRAAQQADRWQAVLDRAEAEGVLVLTCDLQASRLDYGLLAPLPGGDREKPEGYTKGSYGRGLLIPGDGRTYASMESLSDYAYGPTGGMSWGAPYLAGLAALGLQVDPALTPARLRTYLVRSASAMPYGTVINPAAFVRLCREDPDGKR